MKYLLILIAIVVAYWIIKSYKRKAGGSATPGASAPGEDLVRCAHCGVHLPRSESVMTGQIFFCSPDHRRLHESR